MKLLIAAATLVVLALGLQIVTAATPTQVYLPIIACPTCSGIVPALPTPTPDPAAVDPVRRELLALVNAARAEAGCPAAREDPLLMQATQAWSVYRATVVDAGHANADWYTSRGIDYARLENIGGVHADAQIMFTKWWYSPYHYDNMLYCDIDDVEYVMGVGYLDTKWTFALGWYKP